ncbi:MAG: ribbon-helix-helix protein, CopG family [Christensenellales bacterium]
MHGKIQISKKDKIKGEDGYKTFSIRVKEETVKKLDEIVDLSNRSRNELINMFLDYGVENFEIIE